MPKWRLANVELPRTTPIVRPVRRMIIAARCAVIFLPRSRIPS